MPSWPEHDQRRSRRIHVHGEAEGTGAPLFKGSVVNLSSGGICVEHLEKLELGQACDLRFRIPPMTFAARARIVWTHLHREGGDTPGGPRLFRSGAEFTDISEDARATIEFIVSRPPA